MIDRPVHPAAAVFPMLPDDELRELADDIKANGLRHPIVLDREGRIIDGRNRYAACLLAGVEPTFITFDGDENEIVSYILSLNVHRRHLTEGQRAIGTVRAERCKLHHSEINRTALANESGLEKARIVQALVIVEWAPELADAVMAKTRPFSKAFEDARAIRDAKQERETAAVADRRRLERIEAADRDLALLVSEGRLTLTAAMAELDERERQEQDRRRRATVGFGKATSYLFALLQADPEQIVRDWLPAENGCAGIAGCEHLWTSAGLADLAAMLGRVAEAWEETDDAAIASGH